MKKKYRLLLLTVLLLFLLLLSMNAGKIGLTPKEVFSVILGHGTQNQITIVTQFRLPRIVLAILVGTGMGIAGCIMQSLLRNDMASPGTLGISSGSGLFVLVYVLMFSTQGLSSAIIMPILAFLGGFSAALLIYFLANERKRQISPSGLILTGVALSSGYRSLTLMMTLKLDENQMSFVQRWNAGSLWGDDWVYLRVMAPIIIALGLYLFWKSRTLNIINLGNQTATGLGVKVKREFLTMSLVAVALTSVSVALGGNFFFVGLIGPHIAKKLIGADHSYLIPTSALCSSLLVLAADTLTRTVDFGSEVPAGLIITVISTPYFLYLLSKSNS